jgi:5-methylcytosine-specific restriction endonuclease McrA
MAKSKLPKDSEYNDPRWQKVRLTVFNRDEFKCIMCKSGDTELHCHHKTYTRGKPVWEYELSNFSTVCKTCHERITEIKSKVGSYLDSWWALDLFERALEIADGDYGNYYCELTSIITNSQQVLPALTEVAATICREIEAGVNGK